VSRLLRALRIAGLREVEGKEEPAPWPAIITAREHHALLTVLARNKKAGTRSQRSYLLTGGLVVCGGCGKKMIGRTISTYRKVEGKEEHVRISATPTYGCDKTRGGCGKVWVKAERVDDVVRDAVIAIVDKPGLARRLERRAGKVDDRVLDAITRQETRLREVEADYANGELDRAEYRRLRDGARAKLEELRAGYQPKPTIEFGSGNPLGVAWPALPLGRRRAVLDVVLDAVEIGPVGHRKGQHFGAKDRFDGSRVSLRWKV
jgi:hypothetical protein